MVVAIIERQNREGTENALVLFPTSHRDVHCRTFFNARIGAGDVTQKAEGAAGVKQALAQGFSAGVDWCRNSSTPTLQRLRWQSVWRPKKPPLVQFGKRDEGEKNGDAMTREDIATGRALKMHDLALSVVRTKGAPKLDGSTTVLEYRYGLLTIHYRSGVGALDVWCVHKVLVVDRFAGKPQLIRYVPGAWERVLMQAATKVIA